MRKTTVSSTSGAVQHPAARTGSRRLAGSSSWLTIGLAMAALGGGLPSVVLAAPPPPPPISVGQNVINPVSGKDEKVVEVITPSTVRTDQGNIILLAMAKDDIFTVKTKDGPVNYTVTGVVKNSDGRVIQVKYKDAKGDEKTIDRVYDKSKEIDGVPTYGAGGDGSGTTLITFKKAVDDINNYVASSAGVNGGDGHDGGGVSICFGILGCIEIAYNPSAGGDGANGIDYDRVVDSSWGNIQTISKKLPGIVVSSVGGDGGQGGDAYGNIKAAPGGRAGVGGTVKLNNSVEVTTDGEDAYGIFAQSRAGRGGKGGKGFIFSAGGGGGSAAQAGTVEVTNSGKIITTNKNAIGIFAQSLGGASGDGGSSYGIIGEGGGGNAGGDGNTVSVTNSGKVQTGGDYAHGIFAQSVGGSGGNAGDAGGIVTFGNTGSAGGNGAAASITAKTGSSVLTTGKRAYGLFAQSVGGGGGSGGLSTGLVTLGSDGGAGGDGGTATITIESGATVSTTGENSHGVFAQSVGGGGGDAGVSGGLVTLGGGGKKGGRASTVTVTSAGTVTTDGIDSRGIFAQSVGGGGGSAAGSGGIFALGGAGEVGGPGGDVSAKIEATGSVITTKAGSDGVFAQSVGGGGGSGGSTGGLVSLGGKGAGGGQGGVVGIDNAGLVWTKGKYARGIFAQSVGGGGGSGGDSGGLVSIGGEAGPGSTGGHVTVGNSGSIITEGNQATGLQAQSVGGGGGDGGTSGGVFLVIGGKGSSGGDGGLVTVNHVGNITTSGNDSHGIFAQSVGGGGGNGGSSHSVSAFAGVSLGGDGDSGGKGGEVDLTFTNRTATGEITTIGDRSRGVFAQSVGGGGGSGGLAAQMSVGFGGAVSVAIGGKGAGGGAGGKVHVGDVVSCFTASTCYGTSKNDLKILTSGDNAEGMYIQSVGGGGGSGGYAISTAIAASPGVAVSLSAAVGGAGGAGGAGGEVIVRTGGSIQTGEIGGAFVMKDGVATTTVRNNGQFATGLLAQSVGGGGGKGGFSISASVAAAGGGALAMAGGIGGSGGKGGDGGLTDVDFNGSITTLGDDAAGALIQSVGGGGGSGGYNISGAVGLSGGVGGGGSLGIGGSGDTGGIGGTALGTIGGKVQTLGARSTGVIVQSVGGGGGNGGFNISGAVGAAGGTGGALAVGLGGTGKGGGIGGRAEGRTLDTIDTYGNDSGGLLVQSVGGGGGNGGFNISGTIGAGGGGGGAVSVGIGGSAGKGSSGGYAYGSAGGAVTTGGYRSVGVTVQSLGGGGGNGGFNISGSLGVGGVGGGAISVGLGGKGGGGGEGGEVHGFATSISTLKDGSGGFLAQSVGGGGGNGGFSIAGSIGAGGTAGGGLSVSIGGSGGDGGSADWTEGRVSGAVRTEGKDATGVVVQSLGGGGGNGGFTVAAGIGGGGTAGGSINVGVGGSGGKAGHGGQVDASAAAITTLDDRSGGFLAQSIGGGGGNGGFSIGAGIGGGGTAGGAISVSVGGAGAGGGTGGKVTGRVNGLVLTQGDSSTGVTVQSLGGGGGNGGFSVAGSIGAGGTGGGAISVALGGSGGGAGEGGEVHGFATSIGTQGKDSGGFLAQSVGGGGGNGGFSIGAGIGGGGTGGGAISVSIGGAGGGGGSGGYVEGRVSGLVSTEGTGATGVTVQSLGGGGGNGGFSVAGGIGGGGTGGGAIQVGLGGGGGLAGNGGEVDASAVAITTTKDRSGGFLAQSVGGGGGNGGFSVAGGIGGGGTGGGAISVGIGGSGAGGGFGARVGAMVTGNVYTAGAESDAIVAQSLGGGGGNGGFAVAGSIGVGGTGGGAVSVGVGGSGGGGGDAGKVDLTVTGITETLGKGSDGIIAQSIGGGGGNGGFSVAGSIAAGGTGAGTVGVSVGGSGGDGGNSLDKVTLNVTGGVVTSGDTVAVVTHETGARGVLAQSVGGGGGNGGFSVVAGIALAKTGAGNIGVGVGGSGGDGGYSSAVEGNVTGDVTTLGASDAGGVLIQSVGGGGGNGGFNVSGGIAASTKGAGNVLVGVGGMGGDGGNSGAVTGTVTGNVYTAGANSGGVTYQSLAGGGGNGGFNVTGGIALSAGGNSGVAGNIGVGVGGFGGKGSDAELVDASVIGDVTALGDKSYGILMQSVGGGGGQGAFNVTGSLTASTSKGGSIGVGLGGFGGGGGHASTVDGILTGDVYTRGDEAFGAMLQSLGGSGGNGGFNITASATLTGGDNASLGVGIGGFGGSGGYSGNVHGEVTGAYETHGVNSDGVVVQSLGGGGGNGGMNVTGQLNVSTKGKSGQASIGIGGFGGDGGASGTAWLLRTGDTLTTGKDSEAIIVQSLAGGGGNGAINVTGGLVASSGDNASINIGIGGFGGKASNADAVTATVIGNVWALGMGAGAGGSDSPNLFSGALVAQSVGGGGGNGGLNVSGGIALTKQASSGKAAAIGIGGFGGGGGNGGTVDLTVKAPGSDRVQVVVDGDNRAAIIAQSLGGGGGLGGMNVSGGIASNSSLAFGMGGFGGDGGLAKKVTADVDADIQATGDGARGLFAQSLGGGGGAGGINVSGTVNINSKDDTSITFGLGGFGGAGNISGDVDVKQKGLVIVTGKDAFGIVAQSVAGGGGDGGLNVSANIANASAGKTTKRIVAGVGGMAGDGADAGDVKLNSVGDIVVTGPDSTSPEDNPDDELTVVFTSGGILAQSVGGGGGVGGMNISASVARNAGNTLQFGMGGNGGAGGNAGTVKVTRGYETVAGTETVNASGIETVGDYSSGLVAQSVGGGGGLAGMNFNFAYNKESNPDDGKKYTAAIISVGGSGADAGNGDEVVVRHNGSIVTDGRYSHGLVAQSIGGGGGDSNVNLGAGALGDKTRGVNIGVGGANGSGGTGAKVKVDHVGRIWTQGDDSIGIKAQSIGGGGGSASSINQILDPILDFATGQLDSASLAVNIGRAGGKGATGGAVIVGSDGTIETEGDGSIGILAQSIGGGGGDSGTTSVGGDFAGKSGSYGGNLAIGLDGGESAVSGTVDVTTKGMIHTAGERAHAIFAQSVGGGGGLGGTVGDKLALSPGGDEDTTSANVNIGGAGGKGSHSDQVTVTNSAILWTENDRSSGIWAQSIGGSGGSGGDYLQANIESVKADKTSRTVNINVGGKGGEGAVGYGVKVTNTGAIQTGGLQSFGIRAESIGGGGGDGGAVAQGTLTTGGGSKQSIDINVGGKGGEGAEAGLVEVRNEGSIVTKGFGAEGIRATSTGGGGGNGGVILHTLLASNSGEGKTQALSMNFGGDGGKGGTGGDVMVDNVKTATAGSGTIWTTGDQAHGIFAQSLGGGGGNGSSIVSMTGLRSTADSMAIGLHFGGKGGIGNHSGTVTVSNSGGIFTDGAGAYGILGQSVGGGGGNGGLVIAASVALGEKSKAPILAIGGLGGDGGNGGDVTVTNSGVIQTTGAGSHGIVAQSIGGGGGNAGAGIAATNDLANVVLSNLIALAVGATGGGKGGAGGFVTVNQTGDITVTGEGAQAIVAESINGGGGRLDFNLDGVAGLPGSSVESLFKDIFDIKDNEVVDDPKIAARLGGSDLTDMNAGKVKIISKGTLGVGGDNGLASFDQSVGGGGGTVHIRTRQVDAAATGTTIGAAAISYTVGLGGTNGVNNSGADIDTTHDGALITTGLNSAGVLSQTIGGGGGHAIVDVTTEAGALVGPITLSFGSQSGSHEQGGDILRHQTGSVITTGDLSTGVILQSIGGGGGSASVMVRPAVVPVALSAKLAGDAAVAKSGGHVNAATAPVTSTVSFGATGGTLLDGGDIDSTFSGGVSTAGAHALGIFAQSIGAGGGEVRLSAVDDLDITLGGSSGASGIGGMVKVSNAGDVETAGAGSHGIFLQSIGGGGGGVFGAGTGSSLVLNGANTGDGGVIDFRQVGSVMTSGVGAYGVAAQSLGGGGGWVDGLFAGTAGGSGHGGAIGLNVDGAVFASGAGSTAIFAQSLGSLGGGNITVDATKLVRGNAIGISLDGGASNVVTTKGSVSAVSGLAIKATTGDDRILNDGVVIGNIDLGSGANSFSNRAGSTFVAFNTIDLYDGAGPVPASATFSNAGDFLMGLSAPRVPIDLANYGVFDTLDGSGNSLTNLMFGSRVINQVALDGNFVQASTGHMAFDVAFGPYASDKVNVTGNATVAGTGDVVLTWLENAKPVTLFATGGDGADNGLKITDTLAMDYSIVADTAGVHLAFTSDYAQPFLNRNEGEIGRHMDSAIAAGDSGGIGRLMALIGNLQAGEEDRYKAIFDQLNPEPFMAPLFTQVTAGRQFAGEMLKCDQGGVAPADSCIWGHAASISSKRKADYESFGYDSAMASFQAGREDRINEAWSVAAAIGYDSIDELLVHDNKAWSKGNAFKAGLGFKRRYTGGSVLGLSLSGGFQSMEIERSVSVFAPGIGTSTPSSGYLMARSSFGHAWVKDQYFVQPAINLSVTALHQYAFKETGLEGLGASGAARTQVFMTLNPEVTFGMIMDQRADSYSVVSFNVGALKQSTDRLKMPFRLVGANPASDPAQISTAFDDYNLRYGADVQYVGKGDKFSLRLSFVNEVGKRDSNQNFSMSLRYKF